MIFITLGGNAYSEYVYNTSAWMLDRANHTLLRGADNATTVSEAWYYYDGQNISSPPTKGDLTREVRWLDTGDDPATHYAYDAYGNLVNATDALGRVTLTAYDASHTFPTAVTNALGHVANYSYDPGNGNLAWQRDNKSVYTNYSFDALDRLFLAWANGSPAYNYTYDVQLNGSLYSIDITNESYNYEYDNRLRKTTETHRLRGQPFVTRWSYDSLDRLVNMTLPSGRMVNFSYNMQGQLESAGNYLTDVDYNAVEKITRKRYGDGVNTHYTYRPDNYRLTRINTPTLQDFSYTYDGVGNVLSIGNGLRGTTEYFGYDALHRLTSAYETNGYNLSYAYNPIGNLVKIRDDLLSYGAGAGPHALTSYDDRTPPLVSFTGGFMLNNSYSNDPLPVITAALNDNFGNASAILEWNITGANGTNTTMINAGGTLATAFKSLTDGTYYYRVWTLDSAGNTGSTGVRTLTIDTVPPAINLTTPLNSSILDTVFVHMGASVNENVTDWTYSRGGSERVPFAFHYLLRYLKGDNILTVLARDLAGNLGWATSRFNVNVSSLASNPPQIRLFSTLANTNSPGENITMNILIVNYNDEELRDGLTIIVKDPSGISQYREWRRVWMRGKDVYQIKFKYTIPADAPLGRWIVRAEFTEDAARHASPASKWFEVVSQ